LQNPNFYAKKWPLVWRHLTVSGISTPKQAKKFGVIFQFLSFPRQTGQKTWRHFPVSIVSTPNRPKTWRHFPVSIVSTPNRPKIWRHLTVSGLSTPKRANKQIASQLMATNLDNQSK